MAPRSKRSKAREAEFIQRIDACFPAERARLSEALIEEACSISPNAAFMVASELARPARNAKASVKQRLSRLDHWESRFRHPLARSIANLARCCIRRERPPRRLLGAVAKALEQESDDYWNAIQVWSCAGYLEIDLLEEQILAAWKRRRT